MRSAAVRAEDHLVCIHILGLADRERRHPREAVSWNADLGDIFTMFGRKGKATKLGFTLAAVLRVE